MKKYLFLFLFLSFFTKNYGQYHFSGEVNPEYYQATAYLAYVEDYTKIDLFKTDQIIQESSINELGQFSFKGDALENSNRIYKIIIDNCHENITNYTHLLNQCEDLKSIAFIAKNTDTIHFPLNEISQVFCLVENENPINTALIKIDSFQEELLYDIQDAKSNFQKKAIYKKYFLEMKKRSQTFDEPLTELYAYNLYANQNTFSRKFYLKDLQKSKYYKKLLQKLASHYANTKYYTEFKEELARDYTPYLQKKTTKLSFLSYVLGLLLLFSLGINYYFWKNKKDKVELLDYQVVLSPQEQKVFILMNEKLSNKEIAEKLFISVSTVKSHINTIYTKLSITSRKEISSFF